MKRYVNFKFVQNKGITAIIINRGKILLAKRSLIPFMMNPGAWAFVSGKKERNENYKSAAYREISEETGIKKKELKLLASHPKIMKYDRGSGKKFYDRLYVFSSKTRKVKLNFEHSGFKWVAIKEIISGTDQAEGFVDKEFVIRVIKDNLKSR